jgi:hypothetical protein
MGRLRQFFESVVYAGLKPTGAPVPPPRTGWLGRLKRAWDRLLSGSMPTDPLYLSNRTWKQKLKVASAVCAPVLIVVGIFVYSLLTPPPAPEKPPVELTPAEVAARTQIIPKDFKVPQNVDVQVGEVSVDRTSTPNRISGTLQNVSEKRFSNVELTFDLTDQDGSQVGGARTVVPDIGPHATKNFSFAIPQHNAKFVLVRETRPIF